LYFAFEESPSQILRNMKSLNLPLEKWIKAGLLQIISVRPTTMGLENHLASMGQEIQDFAPNVVVVDPITNLISAGNQSSVKAMLTRLIDLLKGSQITALFTNLSLNNENQTSTEISSLMDTWIMVRDIEQNGARKRAIYVLKARGMEHSSEVREFTISSRGVRVNSASESKPQLRKQG
jgi:circadian clock protein KaiC